MSEFVSISYSAYLLMSEFVQNPDLPDFLHNPLPDDNIHPKYGVNMEKIRILDHSSESRFPFLSNLTTIQIYGKKITKESAC
jgi:hypothetical protein